MQANSLVCVSAETLAMFSCSVSNGEIEMGYRFQMKGRITSVTQSDSRTELVFGRDNLQALSVSIKRTLTKTRRLTRLSRRPIIELAEFDLSLSDLHL